MSKNIFRMLVLALSICQMSFCGRRGKKGNTGKIYQDQTTEVHRCVVPMVNNEAGRAEAARGSIQDRLTIKTYKAGMLNLYNVLSLVNCAYPAQVELAHNRIKAEKKFDIEWVYSFMRQIKTDNDGIKKAIEYAVDDLSDDGTQGQRLYFVAFVVFLFLKPDLLHQTSEDFDNDDKLRHAMNSEEGFVHWLKAIVPNLEENSDIRKILGSVGFDNRCVDFYRNSPQSF